MFATKRAERLRERMQPRRRSEMPHMAAPSPATRSSSILQLHNRMTALQKDRKSQGHLRQTMILPPRPLQWWEKEVVEYAFSHPHVRNRLERLMGSNVTRLTDRAFMQRLAERIQEEHVLQLQKRIRAREEAEVEREKKLILEGKIPVDQVPQELAEHPVFKISRITSEAIEFRRSKVQHPTMRASYIPEATLLALAKAMAPEEEEEEEEKEAVLTALETVLERVGEEEDEREREEEAETKVTVPETQEELSEDKEQMMGEVKEKLKQGIEKHDEKRDMLQELGDSLSRQVDQEEKRKEFEEMLEGEVKKKVERHAQEEESDEDLDDEEAVQHISGIISDILDFPSPELSFDDLDEDAKRQMVLLEAKRLKEHRQSRLTKKSGVSFYDGDEGRQLSDEEIQREKATIERTSVMVTARNEWQAEVDMQEALARDRDKNYVMSERDLRRLRYEAPLIEELRKQETVADLYRLADEIVGGLWSKIPQHTKEDFS